MSIMAGTERPRVGVSSCLLGEEVRFNGGHKRSRFLTDELGPHVDWVPYCPEVEIGLGTPREPIRLTADGRLVNRSGTADHTAAMAGPAATRCGGRVRVQGQVAELRRVGHSAVRRRRAGGRDGGAWSVRGAGHGRVPAAGGGGRGAAVRRRAAGGVRGAGVRRRAAAFAAGRGVGAADLVAFHARHKLQLLAHDPVRYRSAGRLVAAAGTVRRVRRPSRPTGSCS